MASLDVLGIYTTADLVPGTLRVLGIGAEAGEVVGSSLDVLGVYTNAGQDVVAITQPPAPIQYPGDRFVVRAATQASAVDWSVTGPLEIFTQAGNEAQIDVLSVMPTSPSPTDRTVATVTASVASGSTSTASTEIVPQVSWSLAQGGAPAMIVPGASGTAVVGSLIHYPPNNSGNIARWDASGAIYSSSSWIDVWGGTSPSAISAVFSGLVSNNEISEMHNTPELILMPVQSGGSWTLQIRRAGTTVATSPWDNTGQRISIGSDGSTFYVQTGSLDYQTPVTSLGDVFFCFPNGPPRMRDIIVGTWPLVGPLTWVGGGPEPVLP